MRKVGLAGVMLFVGALNFITPAYASVTSFDCDVPPDRFSTISQEIVGRMMISGQVQLVERRSGKFAPLTGARLASSDGNNSVTLRLVALPKQTKQLAVFLATRQGNDQKRNMVTQVPADDSVAFNLSIDDVGTATLAINGSKFKVAFVPLPGGKASAFCSTAQSKFSGLSFSADEKAAIAPLP